MSDFGFIVQGPDAVIQRDSGTVPVFVTGATGPAGASTAEAEAAADAAQTSSDEAAASAAAASAAASAAGDAEAAAALYAAAAEAFANGLYPDTAAGLAGTADGGYFLVAGSGNTFATLYKDVGGVATAQGLEIPSLAAIRPDYRQLGPVNIFNKDDITDGKYITGGVLNDFADWYVTGFIPVIPGTTITFNLSMASVAPYGLQWFDDNQVFMPGAAGSGTGPAADTPVTVPAGAYYLRTSVNRANSPWSKLMIVQGSVLPDDYLPFGIAGIVAGTTDARRLATRRPSDSLGVLNLFDYANRLANMILVNGVISPIGVPVSVTNYIPVFPGMQFISSLKSVDGDIYGAQYYDQDFTYLPIAGIQVLANTPVTVPDYPSSPPAYVRWTTHDADQSDMMVVAGDTLPTHFRPFGVTEGAARDHNRNWGKSFGILGDSITLMGTWQPSLFRSLGATYENLHAVSGDPMASALGGVVAGDVADKDWIILFLGTNDFGFNTTLGAYSDAAGAATFVGHMRTVLETLIGWKNTLKAAIFTPLQRNDVAAVNAGGKTLLDFADMMIRIGGDYGFPVLDLTRNSGMNRINAGAYTSDGAHPTAAGGPLIISAPARAFFDTVA